MLYKELTIPFTKSFEKIPSIVFKVLFVSILAFTFLGCINFFLQQGTMILISLVLIIIFIFLKRKIFLDLISLFSIVFAIFYSLAAFIYYKEMLFTSLLYSFSLVIFVQFFYTFKNKNLLLFSLGGTYVIGLFSSFLLIVIRTYLTQGLSFAGDAVNNFWDGSIVARTGLSLYEMAFIGVMFSLICFKNKFQKWYFLPIPIFVIFFCCIVSFLVGNRSFIVAIAFLIYFILAYVILISKKWVKWAVIFGIYSVLIVGSLILVLLSNREIITIPPELMKINIINRIFSLNLSEGRPEIMQTFFSEGYKFPFGGFSSYLNGGYIHNFILDFYTFGGFIPLCLAVTFMVVLVKDLITFIRKSGLVGYEKGLIVCVIFSIIGIGFVEPIYQANPNCVVVLFLSFLYLRYECEQIKAKANECLEKE